MERIFFFSERLDRTSTQHLTLRTFRNDGWVVRLFFSLVSDSLKLFLTGRFKLLRYNAGLGQSLTTLYTVTLRCNTVCKKFRSFKGFFVCLFDIFVQSVSQVKVVCIKQQVIAKLLRSCILTSAVTDDFNGSLQK